MTAPARLPAETIPHTYYHPEVKGPVESTVTLDAGRMPTVKGRGGVVADRTKRVKPRRAGNGKLVPYLLPVYMLAKLRDPDGYEELFVLSVNDRDYWRNDPDKAHMHPAQQPERFTVELWDATPEYGDTEEPDVDASWDSGNPVLGFSLPNSTTLAGARAACEEVARLLASGALHPLAGQRSDEAVARERVHRRWKWQPLVHRLWAQDQQRAQALIERLERSFTNWHDRRARIVFRRANTRVMRSLAQAEKAMRAEAMRHEPHTHRALRRAKKRTRPLRSIFID